MDGKEEGVLEKGCGIRVEKYLTEWSKDGSMWRVREG